MRPWLLALSLLLACGGDPSRPAASGPPTHTLTGTIKAPVCGDGYEIVHASVTVRDDGNKVIGSATTTLVERETGFAGMVVHCIAGFEVADVPERDFYQITIGTHDGPTYSLAEMQSADWNLDLSLD